MDRAKRFKLQVAVSFTLIMVLMLSAAKLGWAQSSKDAYKIERFGVGNNVTVDVRTSGGSIDVIGSNSDEVIVEMYVRKRGDYVSASEEDLKDWEIEIYKEGNKVVAHATRENRRNWKWNSNQPSISFVVKAPTNSKTELKTSGGSIELSNLNGEQKAKTSGGSIKALGLIGNIDLHTSGGSIQLGDIEGSVYAKTSGGRITAEQITGDLDVKTSGGSITLEGISGNVDARTSGGSIRAEVISPKDHIDLKTSGGSITVKVPEELGYNIDLDGSSVRADLKNFNGEYERDEIEGTLNGGGTRIKAKTSGGSVRLNYL
jgi:DUF4097 and DUF4098 domain-containing protein YvlB